MACSIVFEYFNKFHFLDIFTIFSAPESKAQAHYCGHALSVVRR